MKKKLIVGAVVFFIILLLIPIIFFGILLIKFVGLPRFVQGYEAGNFSYTLTPNSTMLGIRSSEDTFSIDEVVVELHYSVYPYDYSNPEGLYHHESDTGLLFGIYVCAEEYEESIFSSMLFDDYKNIENHIFMKGATSEEVFGGEYWHKMEYSGITYNHHEDFTIPSEIFIKEKGKLCIKIIPFNTNENYIGYKTCRPNVITLYYQKLNANTIQLLTFKEYYSNSNNNAPLAEVDTEP